MTPFTAPLVTLKEQVGGVKPSCSIVMLQKPVWPVEEFLTEA
jgi:hypothetical protein